MTSTPQPSAKDGSVEARLIANKIACEATSTRSAAAVCRDGALAIDALVSARVEALAKERDHLKERAVGLSERFAKAIAECDEEAENPGDYFASKEHGRAYWKTRAEAFKDAAELAGCLRWVHGIPAELTAARTRAAAKETGT